MNVVASANEEVASNVALYGKPLSFFVVWTLSKANVRLDRFVEEVFEVGGVEVIKRDSGSDGELNINLLLNFRHVGSGISLIVAVVVAVLVVVCCC